MRQVTVNEAADILGITPRGVRLRIERKKLTALKSGREYMVLLDDPEPPKTHSGPDARDDTEEAWGNTCSSEEQRHRLPVQRKGSVRSVLDSWAAVTMDRVEALAIENGTLRARIAELERYVEWLEGEQQLGSAATERGAAAFLRKYFGKNRVR